MEKLSSRPLKQELPNLEQRREYCNSLVKRLSGHMQYPIPIRIEPSESSVANSKYKRVYRSIVIDSQSSGAVYVVIRRELGLKKDESVFMFNGNMLLMYNMDFKEIYEKRKDTDGFLYIYYSETNPF